MHTMPTSQTDDKKEKKATNRAEYSSTAVEKAFDIIEFLATQSNSSSITAIATGTNRTVGEIYRVVLALEHRQIICRDESSDKLRLSLRLFELAHLFPPVERLIQVAKSEMRTLALKSMQSCHLAVAEQREITIVAARESQLPMHYSVRPGSRFDIFETSSGVVIATYMTVLQQEDCLRGLKPAKREELRARFGHVRENGYEMRESETVSGLSNISVPVRSQDGRILAALTVPFLKQKKATLEPEMVLDLQINASLRMSKRLG